MAKTTTQQRRNKGEGSIVELPNGKVRATITLGYQIVDGKRKQVRKTSVEESRQAAVKKLKAWQKEQDEGKIEVPQSPITVKELVDRFLEAKERSVRASTYRHYEMSMRLNVVPFIGDYLVTDVTTDVIDDLVGRWIEKKNMEKVTIKTQRAILKVLFKMAVDKGYIVKNPVADTSRVRVPHKEMKTLSQEEAKRLLGFAKEYSEPMYLLILLALTTGMRRGELLGLCWDCVLDDKIRVWRNLIQTKEGPKLDEPKTTAGRRTISVAKDVVEKLQVMRGDSEYVFRWNGWGDNTTFSRVADAFREVLKRAGISGFRFHDLRHTHATQLISQGVDIKTVSKRLGHEDIKTTLDLYAHWLPENDQRAAELMADWVKGE